MYRLSRMAMLNHHHLFHFWTVVREGGVTRASEKLNVSQPTISGQLRELEEALGEKLLARSGRSVALTEVGRTVYRYADEILGLGRELLDAVKGRPGRPGRLAVGVAMVVPKLVAYQMLEPALRLPERIQLDCVHEKPERLLAELAIYALDLVLADAPGLCAVLCLASETKSGKKETPMTSSQPVSRDQLDRFCIEAMCRSGMTETDARLAADVLVTTDLWGVHTHGTKSLRLYLKRMRAGGLKARGMPRLIKEGPAWAVMDGDNALGMVSSCRAMETASAKAKGAGIGFVSVRNGCHFGAAGYFAHLAVKHDMVGLAMGNADANHDRAGRPGQDRGEQSHRVHAAPAVYAPAPPSR